MCSEKIILCKREITYVDIVENIPILDSKKKHLIIKGLPAILPVFNSMWRGAFQQEA